MLTPEQITSEIHNIAKGFAKASWCVPYVAILQPRRDFREIPAQQLQNHVNRMIDFTSMSVSYHAIDGNPVDVSRCYLMEQAIKDDAKYALFIDEDTALPTYGAVRLIETAEKHPDAIVVGVYYVKFGGPMISRLDEKRRWTYIDATPNTGLRRNIPSCGLGCALIPLSVIKKIQDKFPQIPLFCIVPEGCWGDETIRALGEDTWFYRLAELAGVEVICDTSVQCLHMELKTGKYTAHPDVSLNDYITNMPVTTPLTAQDRNRVSAEYIARIQQPGYINGIGQPTTLASLASDETVQRVVASLRDVQCTQNWWEVAQICERVKALRPKTILEIGVDRGGSMNLWCQFAPADAHYIGVDNAMQFVIKRDTPQTKTLIEADSTKPETLEKVKAALNGAEVDFLFIDGDHTEASVRSDYSMYSPLVRKGGIIAFHDINASINQEHCAGIKKLWSEIRAVDKSAAEFVNTEAECFFGIGMIKKG